MSITIFTNDTNTEFFGAAVKDDGTKYTQTELPTSPRILIEGPRNDTTVYTPVTTTFTTAADADNTFSGIHSGSLSTEGYWKFQFKFTLASGEIVHSRIFHVYVGPTIPAV